MNFETLILIPIIVGVAVNLISFLLTNPFNKDTSDIIIGDGNIIDKSNTSVNLGDTNNTTINNFNQPSSSASDESPIVILIALLSVGVLFHFLQNYNSVIIALSIFTFLLFSTSATIYRNILSSTLNIDFKKSLLSQIKLTTYKLLISAPILIFIYIWLLTGKYSELMVLDSIPDMTSQIIFNHNIMASAISLSLSMIYLIYILLMTTVKLVSISTKVLIYNIDKESFTYWLLSPISKVVNNDYISKVKLRKHLIFTFLITIIMLFGVDLYFTITLSIQNVTL